ncbi:hypothetical protein HYALB_00003037 [Hymenoscyphus albidus]|uniref:Uncharacterized protein n=1 Tax=Hymenoscyphus albidus TaxID=595503 RepID=A0A9N9QBN7_9HELO|nr:hypothetical protein HYALB_00003037 [Hymenoscyphus albidus]
MAKSQTANTLTDYHVTGSLSLYKDSYPHTAQQTDFLESPNSLYIDQLDGSKEKKSKKKDKKGSENASRDPSGAIATGAVDLSRGLMVMAYNSNDLTKGFPYAKVLSGFGSSKENWETFHQHANGKSSAEGWLTKLKNILDIVHEWDVQYFRKKGFLVRLDMPGEQKYGLDFMDLYYEGTGNRKTFNVAHGISGVLHKDKIKETKAKNLTRIREKGFVSTRIVMDPIAILDNETLYEQRGWLRWDQACTHAKNAQINEAKAPKVPMKNEPYKPYVEAENSGFKPHTRVDRWPTSKHFYYERFRGRHIQFPTNDGYRRGSSSSGYRTYDSFWFPDADSMDQRTGGADNSVLPCAELPQEFVMPGRRSNMPNDPFAGLGRKGLTSNGPLGSGLLGNGHLGSGPRYAGLFGGLI